MWLQQYIVSKLLILTLKKNPKIINILNKYIDAIKANQSPEIIISNIRSFVQYLKTSSFQPIIANIKEQKYKDLAGFQKAFISFQNDKKNAFLAIQEFANKTSFLQKHLSGELFAQNISQYFIFFEPFVKLNIRGFNESACRS